MPKKANITGYYVRIDPDLRLCWGDPIELAKRACDQIVQEARRHVDDIGYIEVIEETEAVCEFCGRAWTEDGSTFNGGCCDEDMENCPDD